MWLGLFFFSSRSRTHARFLDVLKLVSVTRSQVDWLGPGAGLRRVEEGRERRHRDAVGGSDLADVAEDDARVQACLPEPRTRGEEGGRAEPRLRPRQQGREQEGTPARDANFDYFIGKLS